MFRALGRAKPGDSLSWYATSGGFHVKQVNKTSAFHVEHSLCGGKHRQHTGHRSMMAAKKRLNPW
jgi:hypothetical protein